MTEPYYLRIKDLKEFLRHYQGIYEGHYNKTRARKITSLFPQLRNRKVLDIGCGGGFYSLEACRRKSENILLVDISQICVKAAKSSLLENANYAAEGVVVDANLLPFGNSYFDFVLCIDVIEHMKEDNVLLREIRRVLKDNGFLLIATQNSSSLNYFLEAPMQRYLFKNRNWMGWDSTHVRFYNPKRLFQLLTNNGFFPVRTTGTYFIPYSLASMVGSIWKRLSEVIFQAMMSINEKLETEPHCILDLFGWGIIYLCVKVKGY